MSKLNTSTFANENVINVAIVMSISFAIVVFIWGIIHYWDNMKKCFAKCMRKKISVSPTPLEEIKVKQVEITN